MEFIKTVKTWLSKKDKFLVISFSIMLIGFLLPFISDTVPSDKYGKGSGYEELKSFLGCQHVLPYINFLLLLILSLIKNKPVQLFLDLLILLLLGFVGFATLSGLGGPYKPVLEVGFYVLVWNSVILFFYLNLRSSSKLR